MARHVSGVVRQVEVTEAGVGAVATEGVSPGPGSHRLRPAVKRLAPVVVREPGPVAERSDVAVAVAVAVAVDGAGRIRDHPAYAQRVRVEQPVAGTLGTPVGVGRTSARPPGSLTESRSGAVIDRDRR